MQVLWLTNQLVMLIMRLLQSGWIIWKGATYLEGISCGMFRMFHTSRTRAFRIQALAHTFLVHCNSDVVLCQTGLGQSNVMPPDRTFGDSADMHAKQLKAAHDKIEKIHARVANCEETGSAVADLHKSHQQVSQDHRDKLSTLHSSVSERLSYLEGLIGESAELHARELEALKSSHSRIASEAKARDAHHATVSERLDYIEKLLGDSADKHAREIKAAHSKIEQVHQRVSGTQQEDHLEHVFSLRACLVFCFSFYQPED